MNSGLYTAYSGLRAQSDALEIVANNLANVNTKGFKEDKAFFSLLDQSLQATNDSESLGRVINSHVLANKAVNPSEGSLSFTNRDLDVAIAGNGFLVVQTPQGIRYTRNGNLHLSPQSVLTTSENFPVLGVSGLPIALGPGKIQIGEDGTVSMSNERVDRLKVVAFDNLTALEKEGNSLFVSRDGAAKEKQSTAAIRSGYLEESNVNPVASMVQMVNILRHFEAIQKSVSLLMNDVNSKAIEKLGQ